MSAKELKEAFLSLRDNMPKEDYQINGKKYIVKSLSSYQIEQWRLWQSSEDEIVKCSASAKLVQLSLCDDKGNRLFEDNEVNKIVGVLGHYIDEIADIALRISGYTTRGREAILKNLKKILGDDGLQELRDSITAQLQSSSEDTPPTSSTSNGS